MSLKNIRFHLVRLLDLIIAVPDEENNTFNFLELPGWSIPEDLLENSSENSVSLYLTDQHESASYFQCLRLLHSEGANGCLEHMQEKEITKALQRLISEVWINRHQFNRPRLKTRVDGFLNDYCIEPITWTVLWEITNLKVKEPVDVGEVEFLHFLPKSEVPWFDFHIYPWSEEVRSLTGKAFARIQVKAGSLEKAVLRSKLQIDDALEILRVAVSAHTWVPDLQRQQQRGDYYFAWTDDDTSQQRAGIQHGFRPVELEFGDDMHSIVTAELDRLRFLFSDGLSAKLKDPLLRALVAIGSSMTRKDLDLRVLDLCISLESILCTKEDPRKAEAISLRYMLLILSIGDPTYVINPIDLYYRYMTRNDIVHGSARRIGTEKACHALQYAAKDSVSRILAVVEQNPHIKRVSGVFRHLEQPENIERAVEFLSKFSSSDEAVTKINALAECWLARPSEVHEA
jgi:hypothetical protein